MAHYGGLKEARRAMKYMGYTERFMEKVLVTKTCWLWTGGRNPAGYGTFRYQNKMHLASRMSLVLIRGERIPSGAIVCHSCDVPACVNPHHLWIGTQKDNIRDMHKKGRDYNGHDKITHCPSGHEYSVENTRVYRNKRHCRQCSREKHRRNAGNV